MQKRKNEINWMLYVAIFILILSLIIFIIALNIDSIISLQKKEIPITVIISNYSAFNISKNQTDLNLGIIKENTFGERNLSISNDYPFKTIFEFKIKGSIAPLMIFEPVIILEPMEDREITFRTKVIENESFGQYSGIILVKIKKLPQ